MSNEPVRRIYYYKNYYLDFFDKLSYAVQRKFNWTLKLVTVIERVPKKFLAHMEGSNGIFEIRVDAENSIYRIFCFFANDQRLILLNAFKKKTRKTPRRDIQLAEKLKKQYFYENNNR